MITIPFTNWHLIREYELGDITNERVHRILANEISVSNQYIKINKEQENQIASLIAENMDLNFKLSKFKHELDSYRQTERKLRTEWTAAVDKLRESEVQNPVKETFTTIPGTESVIAPLPNASDFDANGNYIGYRY